MGELRRPALVRLRGGGRPAGPRDAAPGGSRAGSLERGRAASSATGSSEPVCGARRTCAGVGFVVGFFG
jgi:hypothetical protein